MLHPFLGVYLFVLFFRGFLLLVIFSTARTFGAPQVVTSFSISLRSRVSDVSRFPRQPKNGVVLFRGEVLMLMFLLHVRSRIGMYIDPVFM